VSKDASPWLVYRTRFLVRARRLTRPLVFVDALGREHRGEKGDYLVKSAEGARSITPRKIFEDIYVAMGFSRASLSSLPASAPPSPRTADITRAPEAGETGSKGQAACGKSTAHRASRPLIAFDTICGDNVLTDPIYGSTVAIPYDIIASGNGGGMNARLKKELGRWPRRGNQAPSPKSNSVLPE
jgi:hypothetical protein